MYLLDCMYFFMFTVYVNEKAKHAYIKNTEWSTLISHTQFYYDTEDHENERAKQSFRE